MTDKVKKFGFSNIVLLLWALSAGITEGLTFFNAIPAGIVPDSVKTLLFTLALGLKVIVYTLDYIKKNEAK
jgi:hypothetical protein